MIKSEKYKGLTIELHRHEHPENPRTDWDNVTQMVCFHGRYNLGDVDHGILQKDHNSWEEIRSELEKDAAVILPIYMYDHSGITINTTGFNCQWDSGQVGYIRITKEDAAENWPDYDEDRLYEILVTDVKTYDTYLQGDVVGYIVKTADDEQLEDMACWGFYSHEDAIAEAKGEIDNHWRKKHALFEQAGVEVELPS